MNAQLRGFGFTFDVAGGSTRTWYIDGEGAKRWADNDEIARGLNGQHDIDLLGKEINKPAKPWDPFYCVACAGVSSAKCQKHDTRHCANRGCLECGCDACDLDKGAAP